MNDTEINDDSIVRVGSNDATVTSLSTNNNFQFTDQDADSLGRALQGNNHVKKLSLNVSYLTESGNYDSLLTAIEQSTTLLEIKLHNAPYGFTSGRVAVRFLNAISSAVSIRKVELYYLEDMGTNPFLSLLRSPVSDLTIKNCTFADTSQEGCREIAAGFRANMHVQRLVLIDIASDLIAASLNGVRSHPAVRHLTMEPLDRETATMDTLSDGIGQVLSSTSMLTSLELRYFDFSASNFETIVQGLRRSNPGVNTFSIADNHFEKEATDKFVAQFQNSNNIRTLNVLAGNEFQDTSVGEVVSRILRANNTLENLVVSNNQGDVELILETLQNNVSLKSLKFDSLDGADLASLQRNLPKLRGLKKLSFRISGRIRISAESLLQAFERNGSLEEVEIIQHVGFELFNDEALAKIQSYCLRNKKLPSFLAASVDAASPARRGSHPSSNDDNSHDDKALSGPVMNLRLRAKVYATAQKIEAGGNRMIFRDLIRLGDLIGEDGGGESNDGDESSAKNDQLRKQKRSPEGEQH